MFCMPLNKNDLECYDGARRNIQHMLVNKMCVNLPKV